MVHWHWLVVSASVKAEASRIVLFERTKISYCWLTHEGALSLTRVIGHWNLWRLKRQCCFYHNMYLTAVLYPTLVWENTKTCLFRGWEDSLILQLCTPFTCVFLGALNASDPHLLVWENRRVGLNWKFVVNTTWCEWEFAETCTAYIHTLFR